MQKLSTYELTVDSRHRDGLINVVPIQKIGQWSYEVPRFGMYAAGILISIEFEITKDCLNAVGWIKGARPRRIPQRSESGSMIAFDSAMYRFINQVTLLIQCDGSGNVSAECLDPSQSIEMRHSYLTRRIASLLHHISIGRSDLVNIKYCKFLILKILEERGAWSSETERHVSRFAKKYWHELYFMFVENQKEKHDALDVLLKLR